jgi:hypothetical protein
MINYTYNGVAQTPLSWTGSLAQNSTASITLGEFTPISGTNTITAMVSMPNGVADENEANGSTSSSIETAEQADNVWTVEIITDDYGYETYWEIRSVDGGAVVASGGNTAVGANGGGAQTAGAADPGAYADFTTYTEEVTIPSNGCYEFLIVDDWGDGMCCDFGDGSFSVIDGSANVIVEGAEYTSSVSASRSVVATSLIENAFSEGLELFPNPAADVLNVNIKNASGVYTVRVLNTMGQTVKSGSYNGEQNIQVDISSLASGNYVLEVSNERVNGIKRFTVK